MYRRFPLEYSVPMKFQCGGSAVKVEAISQNVSIGGLLVRSASMIPLHTTVTFAMHAQGEKVIRPICLVGEGKIVRVEKSATDAIFAIAVQCNTPVTHSEDCDCSFGDH